MKKGYVQVTDSYERILHWITGILSFIIVLRVYLGMMFQTFNFIGALFGGLKNMKLVHNFTGLVFAASLVLVIRICGGRKREYLCFLRIWIGSRLRRLPVACG